MPKPLPFLTYSVPVGVPWHHHMKYTMSASPFSGHYMIYLHLVCQHLSKVASRAVGALYVSLLRTYQEIDSTWCAHMGEELNLK